MKKPKRVLLVYYKLFKPGGVAKVLTNLANSLSENGYHVEILLLMDERPHFYPLHSSIKVHNINTFSHWAWTICEYNVKYLRFIPKIRNMNEYIYHIGVFLMLRNWMRKNHQNYDTIISSWYKLSSFLSLNKKVNFKTIAWEHVTYQTGGFLYKDFLRRFYKNLKAIVCINTPSKEYYSSFTKTFFIPNLIGEPFENQSVIDYDVKENILSFVGRLDKEKNVLALLKIFKKSNLSNDWKLQIIGDGVERKNLEKFVEENNFKNEVIFYGTKNSDEILEYLRKSKIFVFTSLKEAFGNVLLEAMFSGNTVIAYNCNYGPSDIVQKNTGFLIHVNDEENFINALQNLCSNPKILEQYMKAATFEAQNWKKEKILSQWKTIL